MTILAAYWSSKQTDLGFSWVSERFGVEGAFEMLAVQSAMDVMRSVGSQGSERQSLLREPSAEDLDAAHQLVSSARGERKNPPANSENQRRDSRDLSIRQPAGTQAPLDTQQPTVEPQERDMIGGFSQVCR